MVLTLHEDRILCKRESERKRKRERGREREGEIIIEKKEEKKSNQ